MRAQAAESIANMPPAEQPTADDLEGYIQMTTPDEDLAWGDKFSELCAWLNDKEYKRKRKAIEEADRPTSSSQTGIGRFNFTR